MKKIIMLAVASSMFLTSCSKFVDGYETSPNDPSQVTPGLLLTNVQVTTFSNYSGQMARLTSLLMQQSSGTDFQFSQFERYNIKESDNTNDWDNHYAAFVNARELERVSGDANPYYRGMARVLLAMNASLTTDLWGDVPFSEAGKGLDGAANFNPAYDTQEAIYTGLNTLLNDAISDFNRADTDNTLLPESDDLIFGGDVNQWIITANVLKARFANHLSKRNPSGSATAALAAIADANTAGLARGFACNANWGTTTNSANQWYAFQENRAGYLQMGAALVNLMNSTNDPRRSFYMTLDAAGAYSGTVAGTDDVSTSKIGTYFASAGAPSPMVTYVEAKFIEAEAAFRSGNTNTAADAFNEAVKAHITLVTGASDPTFEAAQASETSSTITLEKIMTQKYVAMFTQIEVWADWRRTNIPALTPCSNGVISAIPRRLVTPISERNYNTNAVVVSDMTASIWWDQ